MRDPDGEYYRTPRGGSSGMKPIPRPRFHEHATLAELAFRAGVRIGEAIRIVRVATVEAGEVLFDGYLKEAS